MDYCVIILYPKNLFTREHRVGETQNKGDEKEIIKKSRRDTGPAYSIGPLCIAEVCAKKLTKFAMHCS